MVQFEVHLDVVVDADWEVEDLKIALAEFAQEHEVEMEGTIAVVGSPTARLEYFSVD